MTYKFQNATAFDPYSGEGVPNATGQVFAMSDTGFVSPLAVTTLSSGLQTTELVSDQYSQLPGFDAGDHLQVRFRSGDFTKILNTSDPLPGPRGPSAYGIAAENGYTGTEAEYNATLADAGRLVVRAETAEQAAIDAAGLVTAPSGTAVLAAISEGGAARNELTAAIDGRVADPMSTAGAAISATANSSADLARSSTAVITTGRFGVVDYKLIRVIGATGKPGLVGKRFGQDYTSGTPGDGFTPPAETLTSVFQRTGADLVTHGAGWVVEPGNPRDGFMDGCQILDGVLYRDFNQSGNRGRDALGIHYDGSIEFYSALDGDTGQAMVDAGVQHSFSFGPALVKAGVSQAVDSTNISARQILAVTSSGDLLIVEVTGLSLVFGLTYKQSADLAVSLGAVSAIPLDGGGSAQALVQGQWLNPSSDPLTQRPAIDFLTIHAKIVGDTASTWHPLAPENGFTTSLAAVRQRNGQIEYRGSMTNATATGTVQATTIPWWARPEIHQRVPATINLTAGQFYDVEMGGALKMNTTSANTGPRYLSFVSYPANQK